MSSSASPGRSTSHVRLLTAHLDVVIHVIHVRELKYWRVPTLEYRHRGVDKAISLYLPTDSQQELYS